MKEQIKEYAIKNYKKTFTKKTITRDLRGKLQKVDIQVIDPIVDEFELFWTVRNHVDASPIILSKDVLNG